MNKWLRLLIAFGWLSASLAVPLSASAETGPTILISEVAWAGSSLSRADEWLEISNYSNQSINISNWSLTGAATEPIVIPENTILEPSTTYLISNYDQTNEKTTLNAIPDLITTSLSLSNSALGINLQDESATIVDTAGTGGTPPAGTTGGDSGFYTAMKRFDLNTWTDATESIGFDPESTELGTPGAYESLTINTETYDPDQNDPSEPDPGDEPESNQPTEEPEPESTATEPTNTAALAISHPVGTLIINEFVADPVSGEEEWVEIYNPYNNVIPLSGWTLQEAGGSSTDLPDQLLGLQQFVLLKPVKGNLNNSGDTLTLFDPVGNIIDQVSYGEGFEAPAVSDPDSVARDELGNWAETETPTPREPNIITSRVKAEPIIPAPIVIPELREIIVVEPPEETVIEPINYDLRLNEIYPNTTGDDKTEEFIEIVNIGPEPIAIMGWRLEDKSGKAFAIDSTTELKSGDVYIVGRVASSIALNNSGGESVTLIAPDDTKIDRLIYEKTKSGYSLILLNGEWLWTTSPTPNEPNVFSEAALITAETSPTNDVVLASTTAPNLPSTTKTTSTSIEGVVVATPGLLGRQIMYLDGIQVYLYYANWPELAIGDQVQVTGELGSSRNETRIKLSSADDIRFISSGLAPPALEIPVSQIGEPVEGSLIKTQGVILEVETDRFLIENDGVQLMVIAKEDAQIELNQFRPGQVLSVTGIIGQYYDDYRIMPRSDSDLVVLEEQVVTGVGLTAKDEQGNLFSRIATYLSSIVLILLLLLALRHYREQIITKLKPQTINYSQT